MCFWPAKIGPAAIRWRTCAVSQCGPRGGGGQHEPLRDSAELPEATLVEHHAVDGDRAVEEVADILSDACRGDSPSQNRADVVLSGR